MSELFADYAAYAAAMTVASSQQNPLFWPTDEPEPEPAPQSEPEPSKPVVDEQIPEFDPRHRDAFSGLLYVGALSKTFSYFGHSFTISTPTQTEMLQIGQVMEPYAQTATSELAYATALVAAYLTKIDGQDLPQPILNNPKESALHDRFKWVIENLRRPVIQEVFNRCLELDKQVSDVLEAMGKASG